MKLKVFKKNSKPPKIQESECYNCGHPFTGHEKFCPECGQANKDKRITFKSFIHEVFNGFISWDSKFWTTFIPLLIKPGKVSKDYIEGKRMRYANPFRFYLGVSVIFFLIVGIADSVEKFNELRNGQTTIKPSINDQIDVVKNAIDSTTTTNFNNQIKTSLKDLDSTQRAEVLKVIPTLKPDSIKKKSSKVNNNKIQFGTDSKYKKFGEFQKKNPNTPIDTALDSLQVEKTFWNRFIYTRVKTINDINSNDENFKQFIKQLISYVSISLFVLLPLFTLFLKFFYLRKKYTYVEHLVFVFHTQTVFFLLMTIFFVINLFTHKESITAIFLISFLIYLYLAMRKFYNQGHFKTFIKFILINSAFTVLATVGFVVVALLSFALY